MANKFKLRINPTQSKAGRPRNELTESEKESLRNVLDKPDIIFVTRGRKDQRYVGKVDGKSQYVQKWYLMWILNYLLNTAKNIRELSWMSHRVICFWFLWNFLFILAFFDILALLSIFHIFSSGFPGRWKSSRLDIPRTIMKCDYIN